MTTIGYAAMLEQFQPLELLDACVLAEQAGFGAIMVSDHFQPWTPAGASGFSFAFLGALGQRVQVPIGAGVVCPLFRYHPTVVAQAAATLATLYPGRTFLGLGAGELLNEHVVARYWPDGATRVRMLFEAVDIIQTLLSGRTLRHRGDAFQVEPARLFTVPEVAPPIYVATAGPVAAERAGRTVDGVITIGAPDERLRGLFERMEHGARARGRRPDSMRRIIRLQLSWATTTEAATEQALRDWPVAGMRFATADIRTPEDFQAMARHVRAEDVANRVLISADPAEHVAYIQRFIDLGFDDIYLHHVGREQQAFIRMAETSILPALRRRDDAPTDGESSTPGTPHDRTTEAASALQQTPNSGKIDAPGDSGLGAGAGADTDAGRGGRT